MARRTFTPEELQELRDLAARWGKIVARRAFGDNGPGLDVDLDAMEQIARAAASGLTEGTMQTLLEQQTDAAFALGLSGLSSSARHVQQLTQEVGTDLAHARDAQAPKRRRRQLSPRGATPPEVVAVEVDGGRLRTRAAE
jgi:hypothetical protein